MLEYECGCFIVFNVEYFVMDCPRCQQTFLEGEESCWQCGYDPANPGGEARLTHVQDIVAEHEIQEPKTPLSKGLWHMIFPEGKITRPHPYLVLAAVALMLLSYAIYSIAPLFGVEIII
jgi:hypothetical protein